MPRKFKIGDVVRVKGDRKLARVFSSAVSPNLLTLDRKLHGKRLWHAGNLILVRAAPRPKKQLLHTRRAPAKSVKNSRGKVSG